MAMAKVDFGGIIKNICVEWVDAEVGSYVLAHAGMALSMVNEEEARQTLEDFETLARAVEQDEAH